MGCSISHLVGYKDVSSPRRVLQHTPDPSSWHLMGIAVSPALPSPQLWARPRPDPSRCALCPAAGIFFPQMVETMDKLKKSHQEMQAQLAQQQQVQAQMAAAMQAQGMAPPMPPPGAAPPAPGAPGMAPPPGMMAPGLMAPPGGPMQQQQYHAQYQPAMSPLGQGAIQLAAATVPPAGPGPSPGRGDDAAAAAAAAAATPPPQPDSIKESLAKRTNSWMMSLKLSG